MDTGQALAEALDLTPARYYQAIGAYYDPSDPAMHVPAGLAGGHAAEGPPRRGARDPDGHRPALQPPRRSPSSGTQARRLPLKLKPKLRAKLEGRQADRRLWEAVRNWAGRRPVFTVTGRLRANATFCSSRNCIFQGAAADGAILGLWLVWRAGHRLVDFVHDQLVVESPADDRVPGRVAEIEELMKRGMLMVVPGHERQGRDGRHPLAEQGGPGPPLPPEAGLARRGTTPAGGPSARA